MSLNSHELDRYNRHLILDSFGEEGQLKLKAARVLVIGAGGLGCPVLLYLAAAGVGKIGIIDDDVVDSSNLQRQVLFSSNDIGKSKAIQAGVHLAEKNPYIEVEVFNERLTVENVVKCFETYDIIVDGTDNFMTRYLINDACVLLNKTLVYGAVLKYSGQVAVFNHVLSSGLRSATYRCLFPVPPDPDSIIGCSEAGVLGVLPGIIGTLQATETIKIITGIGEVLAGKILSVELKNLNFVTFNLERNEKLWENQANSIEELLVTNYDYFCSHKIEFQSIDHMQFDQLIKSNSSAQIIDVRERNESPSFSEFNFIKIPFNELIVSHNKIDKSKEVVLVCASGKRSKLAIRILKELGFMNLINLEGGLNQWKIKTEKSYNV